MTISQTQPQTMQPGSSLTQSQTQGTTPKPKGMLTEIYEKMDKEKNK